MKLPSKRYQPVSVLGVGGSGVVIKLSDALFPKINNALKFPRPIEGKIRLVAQMLEKEMQFLAEIRHPNIVRILYHTIIPSVPGYGRLPVYLMEAVDGTSSDRFMKQGTTSEKELLAIIRETSGTLDYLHHHPTGGFVHLDIKPDNFVVDANDRPIMIDLGTCKRVSDGDDQTVVACTRSFAHPDLVKLLTKDPSDDNRARGEVKRDEIKVEWDLYSFGLTILSWMGIDYMSGEDREGALAARLTAYTRKYLLLIAARLMPETPFGWVSERIGLPSTLISELKITSFREVVDVLSRLEGHGGPIGRVSELKDSAHAVMQAGPGQHIPVTDRLTAVLDHRHFRRLNSMTQLGVVSQVYPAATHSRREHSLGTYANAIRIIRALWSDPISPLFRQIVTEQDCKDVLLSALLHDIGQFPVAHDLEEIDGRLFDHEELTISMLNGKWKREDSGSREVVFESMKDLFKMWGTSAKRIEAVLTAKASSTTASWREKLLRSIISGPIDADKLDYLMRDGRNTDVPYPEGIDQEMLFRCLTIVIIPKGEGGIKNIPAIGVHAKGRVAAESMSFARYAMFSQV